jgi:hypothetical protein
MQATGSNTQPHYSYVADTASIPVAARQYLLVENHQITLTVIHKERIYALERFLIDHLTADILRQSKIVELKCSMPALIFLRSPYAVFIPAGFQLNSPWPLDNLIPIPPDQEWLTQHLFSFPARVQFAVKTNEIVLLPQFFPGALFMHHSLPLFLWMNHHPKLSALSFVAEFQPSRLYLYAVKKGAPLFFNSFEISCAEDVIYYILFVMEQLGMDTTRQPVYYLGSPSDDPLLQYCNRLLPAFIPASVLNESDSQETAILFPFLLHAPLCES